MFRMGKGMVQVTVSPEPKGSLLILGEGVGLDAVNKSKASMTEQIPDQGQLLIQIRTGKSPP